jgi:hypothetical protein
MSDAGSRGVVIPRNAGAASLGNVESTPRHSEGCTGVKSGTVIVDEQTDERRRVGVGGAPSPARCFLCSAFARFNKSGLQCRWLLWAKASRSKYPKRTAQTMGRDH